MRPNCTPSGGSGPDAQQPRGVRRALYALALLFGWMPVVALGAAGAKAPAYKNPGGTEVPACKNPAGISNSARGFRPGDIGQFTGGVTLVEVYATATDTSGNAVRDLKASDFEVREDGVVQRISTFAAGDFPLSVAVAIDRSWSMAGERLPLAKQAARTFLNELRPTDRALLIAVASDTEVVAPLSTDRTDALRALAALQPWSTSALYDAVIACLEMIQPAGGRRALVLLSDGQDRYSTRTAGEALERARQADVLVYPIAFSRRVAPFFAELAVQTGGRSFAMEDPRGLEKIFGAIAQELRHQYLLGYAPGRPAAAGKTEWRSIEVRALRPGVRVRARPGYFAR